MGRTKAPTPSVAARMKSDQIITEQAKALAETASKAGAVTERIIRIPVTTVCAQSPAMRAATEGVGALVRPK